MYHVELHCPMTFYDTYNGQYFWAKTESRNRESEARILLVSSNGLMKKVTN